MDSKKRDIGGSKINLRMSNDQARANHNAWNHDLIHRFEDNATYFIMGICNVKTLYLSSNTLEVLNYCCEAIPLFNNLTHLTIESDLNIGWESLPDLLKNSPNLETLILLMWGCVLVQTFQRLVGCGRRRGGGGKRDS